MHGFGCTSITCSAELRWELQSFHGCGRRLSVFIPSLILSGGSGRWWWLRCSGAKGWGIVAQPEITTYRLAADDRYIVFCSDGITEFLSNEDIIALCERNERCAPT